MSKWIKRPKPMNASRWLDEVKRAQRSGYTRRRTR
jgi:hypothetical protein